MTDEFPPDPNNDNPFAEPNPYSSPNPDAAGNAPQPLGQEELARSKVFGPSVALMILVPFAILLMLMDAGGRFLTIQSGAPLPMIDADDPVQVKSAQIVNYVCLGVDFVAIALQVFVGWAAWNMKNLRKHGPSLVACAVSCVPCLTACCIVGLPFGIWGLVVLNDPVVRSAFES